MTTTAVHRNPTAMPTGHDDQPGGDGLPVWTPAEGADLVPDVQAWRCLGVGVRTQTFLCWSTKRWAPVIIKAPRPHQLDHPRARLALKREVSALCNNPHPGLPYLYDYDLDGRFPYLSQQHLDGPDLDELLVRRRITTPSIARLATQLLAALVPLHARGLAHLDIKPANVVITNGRAVLIDLGSARRIGSPQPAGRPVGTEGFASPEMEACRPIAAAMDLYGVGATLAAAWGRRVSCTRRAAELRCLITDLTAEEPARRPTLAQALIRSADLAPDRHQPWPTWLQPQSESWLGLAYPSPQVAPASG